MWEKKSRLIVWKLRYIDCFLGVVVNGQTIGDKKIPPDGKINTYFWRFGITHKTLRVKLEVSTSDINVFQDSKWMTMYWSNSISLKGTK